MAQHLICSDNLRNNARRSSIDVLTTRVAMWRQEDAAAEVLVQDLNQVAADGVGWLLCGWALAMFFPALR